VTVLYQNRGSLCIDFIVLCWNTRLLGKIYYDESRRSYEGVSKMVAKLQEIHGDTATIITDKNYTVIIPVQMIPKDAKPGDRIYLECKAEPNQETSFKRIIELENDYINRYY
jgi:hypothetical protein